MYRPALLEQARCEGKETGKALCAVNRHSSLVVKDKGHLHLPKGFCS